MIDIRNADTAVLLGAMYNLYRPSTFILDLMFPFTMEFDTEQVLWDEVADSRKMATFTPPNMRANRNQAQGFTTKSVTAPYIKEDGPVKPGRALKRRAGETMLGELSAEERLALLTLDDLLEYERKILRRKEWMACNLLQNGSVTLSGTNYDGNITLDYNRDAALSITLTGVDRWGEAGVSVLDDIEDWAILVQEKCGVAPRIVIMAGSAWRLARQDTEFRESLDNRRGGEASDSVQLGPVVPEDVSHARYVGHSGDFEFWVYEQTVQDDAGSSISLMPTNTVWMVSQAYEGVQAHGAIQTVDSMVPMAMFPRVYPERNPDALIAEIQSAPVLIPMRPNATLRATVR